MQTPEQKQTGCFQPAKGQPGDRGPTDDHNVEPGLDLGHALRKDGPQPPFDAVARHGVAHTLADHKSKPGVWHIIVQTTHDQFRTAPAMSRFAHLPKGPRLPQTVLSFHGAQSQGGSVLVFGLARSQLHSDVLAPAPAAPFQDVAPPGRAHAHAEAMRFQPLSDFGLPGSSRHALPLQAYGQGTG